MAFLTGTISSKSLAADTHIEVFLPQDGRQYVQGRKTKTLILLHGLFDNSSVWARRTSVERYAERYNLALVMPEVQRSFYCDMKNGQKFFTYITEELPQLIEKLFALSGKREDLLIAGLSMGGYGALKCAFSRPDVFSCCGAFSGCYDMKSLVENAESYVELLGNFPADVHGIFGENPVIKSEDDIPAILKNAAAKKASGILLPKLYMMCGTADFMYQHSADTHKLLDDLQIDHIYEEFPDAIHEWSVWDSAVERFMKHFLAAQFA